MRSPWDRRFFVYTGRLGIELRELFLNSFSVRYAAKKLFSDLMQER